MQRRLVAQALAVTLTAPALSARVLSTPALSVSAADASPARPTAHWVAAWGAAPDSPGPALKPQTLRQLLQPSIAGSALRIRLSNLFGTEALVIGAARLALSAGDSATQPGSSRVLRFGGRTRVTIEPGGSLLSDPLRMPVKALQPLALSLHLPQGATASTVHTFGNQTAYLAIGAADSSSATRLPEGETDDSRYFLTGLDVLAAPAAQALVVVGDSITDGVGSTPNNNRRWTDALAQRLQQRNEPVAVVNAGLAGNRILHGPADPYLGPSALSRFDRDALDQPGARWVLLLQGINDISAAVRLAGGEAPVSAAQILDGLQLLAARTRARGLQVWAATLLPCGGATEPAPHTAESEALRQAVNEGLRRSSAFDALIDLDQVLRDPAQPQRLQAQFDSGDHLHPNDAGYQAMAAAIDLGLFVNRLPQRKT